MRRCRVVALAPLVACSGGHLVRVLCGCGTNYVRVAPEAWGAVQIGQYSGQALRVPDRVAGVPEATEAASGHPAPEIAARVADETEIPRGALAIRKAALAHGWRCVATYARGWRPVRHGDPTDLTDSVALRLSRTGFDGLGPTLDRAVACWINGAGAWKFDMAMAWGSAIALRSLNATELRKHLSGE